MPGDNVVVDVGQRDGNGAGGFAVLDAKTFEVKRWRRTAARHQGQRRLLVPAPQERAHLFTFGEPNAYEKGFDLDCMPWRWPLRQPTHFWNLEQAPA